MEDPSCPLEDYKYRKVSNVKLVVLKYLRNENDLEIILVSLFLYLLVFVFYNNKGSNLA